MEQGALSEREKHAPREQTDGSNADDVTDTNSRCLPGNIPDIYSNGTRNASLDDCQEKDELSAPDGGWGWVIVFGSLLIHIILFGIEKSSGIFFLKFDETFQQSAIVTAWVTTVPGGLRSILGPVCSMLTNKFSFRPVVLAGAILMSAGMVLTGLASNLTVVFFTFAIIEGLGMCLVYSPSVVIVGKYFSSKRGLAVGVATSSFGSFLFPTFIEFVFEYYGFLGAFLMLSGVTLNIMVCASLFTPPPERRARRRLKTTEDCEEASEYFLQHENHSKDVEKYISTEHLQDKSNQTRCFSAISCKKSCFKKSKSELLTMMKDWRFVTFCVAMFLFSIAANSAYAFIPLYAKQIAITDSQSTYVIAMTILADGLGKICLGAALDVGRVKPYRVVAYNLTLLLVGVTYLLLPSTSTFIQLCIVSSLFGLLFGGIMSQKSVVTADILGVKKLTDGFGILMLFQGAGSFVGPPISGLLKDTTGNNDDGFYFGGITTIVGSLTFAVANIVHYLKTKQ
ncbi:monocarboxylate transporter 12-like [Ylistrum balloti]|uniref:monocarboxylate transporter 12-like n=1 Tax=Ylistrum balloti TaxID=509963 RepID=UPI002905DC36|nr:monocarboxylate transporter 12-like [Ylistrum balloti]